ncbi:MAG: SGNH/GDSL hydrolase family protein [Pseudomonadota bacterium]
MVTSRLLNNADTELSEIYFRKAKILSDNARMAQVNNPRKLPTMVAAGIAPVVTANDTVNPNAAGQGKTYLAAPAIFTVSGTPVLASGQYRIKDAIIGATGGNIGLNNGAQASTSRISVEVTGTTVTWRLGPSVAKYRFLVNNQYVDLVGINTTQTAVGPDQYITLDFTAVGGYATRIVAVETQKTCSFQGVYTEANGLIRAVAKPKNWLRAVKLGDSYVDGAAQTTAYGDLYGVQCADWLGINQISMSGSGGTRWGSNTGAVYSFGNRIANGDLALGGFTPDIIFLMGSVNDYVQVAADITNNVAAGVVNARSQYPGALIFVAGTYDAGSGSTAQNTASENAVFAGVAASGVTRGIATVPITTDPNGAWVTAANRPTLFTLGADPQLTHWNDVGNGIAGTWEARAYLNALGSMLF